MMRALIALSLVALAAAAQAAELSHVLAEGEQLEDVAAQYLGSPLAVEALRYYNGIGADPVAAGSTLRVPAPDAAVATETDSWSQLAHDHWGDASLGAELARLNDGDPDATPGAGTLVRIPMLLGYTMEPGGTMVRAARRFLGSADKLDLIQRFNPKVRPDRLQPGSRIQIPLASFGEPETPMETASAPAPAPEPKPARPAERRGAAKETPPAQARPKPEAPAPVAAGAAANPPSSGSELQDAVNDYLDGRFPEALHALEALRADVLANGSNEERDLLLRHLLFLYVAYGDTERACDAHSALEAVTPNPKFDPDLVSPKILRVIRACERS